MILTRVIEVKISENNYSYYENLGYDPIIGEVVTIPIELLSKGSQYKILCECDGCGIQREVIYKNYIKYNNNWGEYFCRKCSESKRKKTLLDNHGVEYPIQSDIIKAKIENTMIKKYGVNNAKKIKINDRDKNK